MQIVLVDKSFEEVNSFRTLSTISSWIIDLYFQEIHSTKTILNCSQMFDIYRTFQSNIQLNEFVDCCQKKLTKSNEHCSIMIEYENYLNRCDLIDIFDILHQCQIESKFERVFLSKTNIRTEFDRMIFQHWSERSAVSVEISDFNIISIENQILHEQVKQIRAHLFLPFV